MSEVWDALGPLYAKLGLATSAEIINARKTAAEAGYKAFKQVHLAGALRAALGIGDIAEVKPLIDAMRVADPTLDVEPADHESQLLVGAVLQAEIKQGTALGKLSALGLVTSSFGATRQSITTPNLIQFGRQALADAQYAAGSPPKGLIAAKRPDDVTATIDGITTLNTNYGGTVTVPTTIAAIKRVADYAESAHAAAATQANAAMAYTRKLEEELRTYWWVVGGWSDHLGKPFRDLGQSEAAIRAGAELADKTTLPIGLFAAPALIDKVVRQDRKGKIGKIALAEAVQSVDVAWRGGFKNTAEVFGDLLPVTLALHLSAESEGADDWMPRFKRRTGVDPQTGMGTLDLGVQMYREVVLARALVSAKQ